MEIGNGDRYLESLVKYVENNAEPLIEGTLVLKLNSVGLRYVQSRLEALAELESLLAGAPVDYLRAYVSDLGDHRALEQLRRILRLLPSLKVVSGLPPTARDPTPLCLLPFLRLKILELRGCDLSTSAARGLLELRHTLEKLICHNSTDALRHVFASRIAEIKNSPQWNRLSFVSCAYNALLLMDESLQLLPAIDTLDLSRNKFTKVDNLRKCAKLKYLDLGFNHLRSLASFSEVSCQIIKLVLRNNALTTLHGIQNLKSLEGLDVSYNMISSFSEIDILASLPSLQSLLLEGNPICFARWYRAKVFSYFPFPKNLRLDEKKISTRDFWKRQIIIASRQQQPASFGFYSPAKDDAEGNGIANTKRKRMSRLVSFESEDQSTYVCSDQDSGTGDSDFQSKKEDANSDEEAEIVDLMNRIEMMKKERSALWLQEFKEWISPASQSFDVGKFTGSKCIVNEKVNLNDNTRDKHPGETSRHMSDSLHFSGDDSSTNVLESDNSFADTSVGLNAQSSLDRIGEVASRFMGNNDGDSLPVVRSFRTSKEHLNFLNSEGHMSSKNRNLLMDSSKAPGGVKIMGEDMIRPSIATNDLVESYSSSVAAGSPPHYQEDILQRRHNLEEEFLQLSVESFSVASSDSNTSDGEDDSVEFGSCIPQIDQSLIEKFSERSMDNFSSTLCLDDVHSDGDNIAAAPQNGIHAWYEGTSRNPGVKNKDGWFEKKIQKRKAVRRIISLAEEENDDIEKEAYQKSNGVWEIRTDEMRQMCQDRDVLKSIDEKTAWKEGMNAFSAKDSGDTTTGEESLRERVINFLNSSTVNTGVPETCRQFVCCRCLLLEKSEWVEMDVGVLTSENKLYVLLLGDKYDGSVADLKLLGCHEIEEVREVFIGLGLEVIRVCCKDISYLFINLSAERSSKLLTLLDSFDSSLIQGSCKSLEQIQVDNFARHICGDSKMSIFQYSMVLFWHSNLEEDLWLSRSLFVLKWQLFVCIEDLKQFSNLLENKSSSSYFSMDHSCSIINISELVIDCKDRMGVTLALKHAVPERGKRDQNNVTHTEGQLSSGPVTWKLKWFSEESLYKFVVLLKAIHNEVSASPLQVQCIS